MTAVVPDPLFPDQLAGWLYNEASGVLYGPDPDHPGLRYPVATDVQPPFGHLIAETMNRAAEVEARVQAADDQAQELARGILAMRVELDAARAEVQTAANQRAVGALRELLAVLDRITVGRKPQALEDAMEAARAAALASLAPAGPHLTDAEAGCASCPHSRDRHAHDHAPGEAYCVADGCPCMNYRSASGQGAALASPAPAPRAEEPTS